MKEGFTFKKVSLIFLRKVNFKNFGGGGEQKRALVIVEAKVIDIGRLKRYFFYTLIAILHEHVRQNWNLKAMKCSLLLKLQQLIVIPQKTFGINQISP